MNYLIVTNSCPFSHDKQGNKIVTTSNVGGVATALKSMLEKFGGTWICWGRGSADENFCEEKYNNYTLKRIMLTRRERQGFYEEYSNGVLWPLFHYFRDKIKFMPVSYKIYNEVNKKFAKEISQNIENNSVIWINDYQLTMVPFHLRQMGIKNKIIFTWHIPWVSKEFYSILPEGRDIIQSLSMSDVLTFHTKLYTNNFTETYRFLFNEKPHSKVYSIPLGIDASFFSYERARKIKYDGIANKKIIFSIDRLDYTKGLINRVLAIERMLKKFPELAGKFVYVMNVTPSRTNVPEYIKMKKEIEMTVGRVNGEFSTMSWTPIIYMYRKIKDSTLLSYYKIADVALITPLIDGLNLVSKEFISVTRKGVLIISKFAGSACYLNDALHVNPYNLDEIADAIVTAINMDEGEKYDRLQKLKMEVQKKDSTWWYKKIISKVA
ncbi:trehalose-6-phosphate synthase [Acidiplasma sp.]|uniref:alpha,alpha-trehalose-phosphate synthase (UDP-forming) n=1 Tax=Acidiplasma sp. TaxID=1872114 RepID=UPI00258E3EBA|nr:trehalose-6-phosphate synthase [Acidiplasma sp.]